MRGAIGLSALLLCTLLSALSPVIAWESDWRAVTMARNASVAVDSSQSQAIAAAIRNCKTLSAEQNDCGAQIVTIRTGWAIAALCGDHKIIVADQSLAAAEKALMDRQIDFQLFYVPDLPACERILTIDPTGAVDEPKPRHLIDRDLWLARRYHCLEGDFACVTFRRGSGGYLSSSRPTTTSQPAIARDQRVCT